jgi:hypothetical protein
VDAGVRIGRGGVVLTLVVPVGDRFREAAATWGDARLMEPEEALAVKAEQALLEIAHLVAGETAVEFEVDGNEIRYDPSDEVASFLAEQAATAGVDEETVLELHVDLFARVFLDSGEQRPAGAPPSE